MRLKLRIRERGLPAPVGQFSTINCHAKPSAGTSGQQNWIRLEKQHVRMIYELNGRNIFKMQALIGKGSIYLQDTGSKETRTKRQILYAIENDGPVTLLWPNIRIGNNQYREIDRHGKYLRVAGLAYSQTDWTVFNHLDTPHLVDRVYCENPSGKRLYDMRGVTYMPVFEPSVGFKGKGQRGLWIESAWETDAPIIPLDVVTPSPLGQYTGRAGQAYYRKIGLNKMDSFKRSMRLNVLDRNNVKGVAWVEVDYLGGVWVKA